VKAITAGKKKSDTIDARTIADLLRCDVLPSCCGTVHGSQNPYTPYRLFRCRPVRTHSIFVADAYSALFPRMDVWPRCLCVGLAKGSRTARYAKTLPVGRTPSAKSWGISASLDCYYHRFPASPKPVKVHMWYL
jgi:hypothetical protein